MGRNKGQGRRGEGSKGDVRGCHGPDQVWEKIDANERHTHTCAQDTLVVTCAKGNQ